MSLRKFSEWEKMNETTENEVDKIVGEIDKKAAVPNSEYITSDFHTIFEDMRHYVREIIDKKIPSLLITGAPGVGKSFCVEDELHKSNYTEDKDYVIIKGKSTAAAMYISLYENNGKLIIYDDCDSIFKDKNAINVLKGALELSGTRRISWDVAKDIKGTNGKIVPKKFSFTGQIIFISNISQKQMDKALKSRSKKIEVALTTDGMIEYINTIMDKVLPDVPMSLKKFTLKLMTAVAKNNDNVRIDVRTFISSIGESEKVDINDPDSMTTLRRRIEQQMSTE